MTGGRKPSRPVETGGLPAPLAMRVYDTLRSRPTEASSRASSTGLKASEGDRKEGPATGVQADQPPAGAVGTGTVVGGPAAARTWARAVAAGSVRAASAATARANALAEQEPLGRAPGWGRPAARKKGGANRRCCMSSSPCTIQIW